MTEDDQWNELEQRIRQSEEAKCSLLAVTEAQRFIQNSKDELGIMTLRKAYEMGYRAGYYDGGKK